jgi:hypothetical protein
MAEAMVNKTRTRTVVQRPILAPQFLRQHVLRMTLTEFAEALDVDKSVISRYEERGIIPEHHHGTVKQLAKDRGIKVPTTWFAAVPWDPKAGVPA